MKLTFADIAGIDADVFRFYHGRVPTVGQGFALYPEHIVTLWWIHKGSVNVTTGDGSPIIAQRDEVFVCMPGVSRYQVFSDNAEITSVWLNVDWGKLKQFKIVGLPKVLDADEHPKLIDGCEKVEALLQKYNISTIMSLEMNEVSLRDGLKLRALGLSLFSELIAGIMAQGVTFITKKTGDSRIAAAVSYLESETSFGTVPYGALTKSTGLSRVHLDRLFREHLNVSPKQFLEKQCFEKSAGLLTQSRKPVHVIAEELNFRSAAHFCSWFKRQCQKTPKQFRNSQVF